ncbi:CinA family protein, partial [Phaeobacter italicus]
MRDAEISPLAIDIIERAKTEGVTIATAESCTAGMISAALTDVAGSSAVV